MSGGYYEDDDGPPGRPQFRPFTRESLAAIEARIVEKEAKKKSGEDQVVSHLFRPSCSLLFSFSQLNLNDDSQSMILSLVFMPLMRCRKD
jgi:hypothetical protein